MRITFGKYNWLQNIYKMFEKHDHEVDVKPANIQEIAIKLAAEQQQLQLADKNILSALERTIFILGSKGVGKTTIINRFFERDEITRPTLALEYSYGRRTGTQQQNVQKQVLNVWELGSLDNAKQLLEVPMRTHGLNNFSAIIILDLAQPQRVWIDLECAYKGLKEATNNLLNADVAAVQRQHLMERAAERVKAANNDLVTLDPMPFPLIIVGGKYDVFMDFEPAIKKHICRCLRAMAHLIGASLLFYSNKIPKLSKTLRDTVSHLGFGSPSNPFRSHITDYNDALSIWFGRDSWTSISEQGVPLSIERIGATLSEEVPQLELDKQQHNMLNDPAKDPGFRESIIDEMRAEKNEELSSIMRDMHLRGKFETVLD